MTANRRPLRAGMAALLIALAAGFVWLGIWQVERREWKHALIAAVEQRSHGNPVAAPEPGDWNVDRDVYRRVHVRGNFVPVRPAFVKAVTERGAGYWVLAPVDTGRFTIFVNRGFVLPEQRDGMEPIARGGVEITGLLRASEPAGGFLRTNDPPADQWFSRDIGAIATARRLRGVVAPYFVDADATLNAADQPVGGLTVVSFADNHMVYALTWFGMAGLCLWGLWRLRSAA